MHSRRPSSMPLIAIVVLAIVVSPMTTQAGETVVDGPLGQKMDDYLTRLTLFGFSGAVLVAKDDRVLLAKGYGLADRERNLPMTPDTVLTVGSITKQFTGAAIAKLQMQGRLEVNDSIIKYLDNVPRDKIGITIHHLLTHTAGLADNLGSGDFEKVDRQRIVRRAMKTPLDNPPGKTHRYSNLGYSLLGAIVENITGQSYETYLYENLFKLAGMEDTGYQRPHWNTDRIAQGYRGDSNWGTVLEKPWAADGPYWNLRANGGIHSTVWDLYKWHQALTGKTVLSEKAKQQYFAPHVDEGSGDSFYGYGWVNWTTIRGTRLLSHNGGNGIFSADFKRYVDESAVIIAMANDPKLPAWRASGQLARILFDLPYNLPPKIISLNTDDLARYIGRYQIDGQSAFQIGVTDTALTVTAVGPAALALLTGADPKLKEYGRRTVSLVTDSANGQYESLHQALAGRMSLERVAEMCRDMWTQRIQDHGPFVECIPFGTAMDGAGFAVSTVNLIFKNGSKCVQYVWDGQQLDGMRSANLPDSLTVYPVSADRFEDFGLDRAASASLQFDFRDDQTVQGVRLLRAGASVSASRVNPQ